MKNFLIKKRSYEDFNEDFIYTVFMCVTGIILFLSNTNVTEKTWTIRE